MRRRRKTEPESKKVKDKKSKPSPFAYRKINTAERCLCKWIDETFEVCVLQCMKPRPLARNGIEYNSLNIRHGYALTFARLNIPILIDYIFHDLKC